MFQNLPWYMPRPHAKFHQNWWVGLGENCGQINTQCVILIRIRAMILVKFLWLQTLPIKFGPNQYGCPFCLSTQKTSWLMKRHILRHTREKPFSCQLCHYSSSRKHQLHSHINYRHTKQQLEFWFHGNRTTYFTSRNC